MTNAQNRTKQEMRRFAHFLYRAHRLTAACGVSSFRIRLS